MIALGFRLPGGRKRAQALGLAVSEPTGIGEGILLPPLGAFARHPQIDQLSHAAPPVGSTTPCVMRSNAVSTRMPHEIGSLLWWRLHRQLNTRLVDGNSLLSEPYRIPANKGAMIID
jgi:hypothetical protein